MRRALVIAIGIAALGALSGVGQPMNVRGRGDPQQADWREIAWPFPRDGWPAGKVLSFATVMSRSTSGQKSASAIATSAWPTTMKSIASLTSI